ncbi:gliding motility-associated C-terminal domain-containing protein [Flavobacterium sp.]|uniref:T9SS type B sorting domain-containing protein n=1 Tax=Flavobacterium sp. TaxID=239 RepID=UPI002626189C|nr:gliding motility-associated C-terminal domain-containing protein [Flavobacterium sp.]
MKKNCRYFLFLLLPLLGVLQLANAQQISLYQQYNGRYGFTFCGNTLNLTENNNLPGVDPPPCLILTESSQELVLQDGDNIVAAYLYWAGSGTGDFEVSLNNTIINAERTFSAVGNNGAAYFAAFADVTTQVINETATTYTLSGLDLTEVIPNYCSFGGNFGGWAIVVVVQNDSLPQCQLNVYDGMQRIPGSVNILLTNLNVVSGIDSQIGFLAWEGDKNIAVGESLTINAITVQNALNPQTNAFNGTNSFTGSSTLYNMDLDVYDLEGFVNPGDTEAEISLSSSQDFVMLNCVVTKLINELPDATVQIMDYEVSCNIRTLDITYQVSNLNSTATLPAGVIVLFRANGSVIGSTVTTVPIPVAGSILGTITLEVSSLLPNPVSIELVVDQNELGQTFVQELNENNNTYVEEIWFPKSPNFNNVSNAISCNVGNGSGFFDFSYARTEAKVNEEDEVSLFYSYEDALAGTNEIAVGNESILSNGSPTTIYVRIRNAAGCETFTSFNLTTQRCKPKVYNLVATDEDGFYDELIIDGLENIFEYDLFIYNRYGRKVWSGNWRTGIWRGKSNVQAWQSDELPEGTYYYVLHLNAEEFPEPLTGFIHLTR